jgi:hypothetical protein
MNVKPKTDTLMIIQAILVRDEKINLIGISHLVEGIMIVVALVDTITHIIIQAGAENKIGTREGTIQDLEAEV